MHLRIDPGVEDLSLSSRSSDIEMTQRDHAVRREGLYG